MAPLQQGNLFKVSPHGIHVATLQLSGSRKVVYYDGVPGPKLDEFFGEDGMGGIAFSPDSNHWPTADCRATSGSYFATGQSSCADQERA